MNQVDALPSSSSLTPAHEDLVDQPPLLVVVTIAKKNSSCLPPKGSFFSMSTLGKIKKLTRRVSDSTTLTVASDISSCLFVDHEEEEQRVTDILSPPLKKSVTFSPRATVKPTISRHHITQEEKRAAWFCKKEYNLISLQCSKQILRLERGEILKDIKYCSRGLESYTRRASQQKHQNRKLAYVAVFEEEDDDGCFHHHHEEDEDERIAKRYHNVSSSCQLWASAIGLQDQRAAEEHIF